MVRPFKSCKWNTHFHRKVSNGKTGLPFQKFRLFRKFSSGTNQKRVFHLHPNRNFRNFLVNGKRPLFSLSFVSCFVLVLECFVSVSVLRFCLFSSALVYFYRFARLPCFERFALFICGLCRLFFKFICCLPCSLITIHL